MNTSVTIKKMILGLMILIGLNAAAQGTTKPAINSSEYKNALGVRLGETSGLTYKHIFAKGNAFEGILSFWPYAVGITGMYEKYLHTGVAGLNLYVGIGAHFNNGSNRSRIYYWYKGREYVYVYHSNDFAVGIDGIFGLEYKFRPIPVAIGFDLKPYFETSNYSDGLYGSLDPGIGIKFTF